ncbi:MAG TPA: hypothetical protein VEL07_09540 [Planctomycetota bacterium]|nr:hypothetical protein [Planctomycetota bacterium]
MVVHIWCGNEGCEIRISEDLTALAERSDEVAALAWCQDHADELGIVCVHMWDERLIATAAFREAR